MKSYHLIYNNGSKIGFIVNQYPNNYSHAPICECCEEPMNLLFQLSVDGLVDLPTKGKIIKGFQCKDVDDGGEGDVHLLIDNECYEPLPNSIPVGYEVVEEPDENLNLSNKQFDECAKSKILGLFVLGGDGYIPRSGGHKMNLLFQMDEDPGDMNFATRSLVVFYHIENNELLLESEFL